MLYLTSSISVYDQVIHCNKEANFSCIKQFVSDELNLKGQVDVIYIDLQEEFDRIDHNILLLGLDAMGVFHKLNK